MAKKHDMTVDSTVNDDGVHIFCSCGEEIPLGHSPSIETVAETAWAHRVAAGKKGKANPKRVRA